MGGADPGGGRPEDATTPHGEAGTDWPPNMGVWLALIPIRSIAMVVCAVVLLPGVRWVMEMTLPYTANWGESFDRVGMMLIISAVTGVALGALLTQPLARGKLHPEARWWQALMAVILLAVVGLVVLTI